MVDEVIMNMNISESFDARALANSAALNITLPLAVKN
jgi:hypothetical protein